MAVPQTPSIPFIDSLIHAYCRTVPWESAFRIVRRAAVTNPTNCPRWPDQFWREAIQKGSGGTCFESNYAVLTLLQALGIDGYLTINNMEDSIGCHSAIIIWLAGQKWLVDVGFPLYAPLPISPHGTMYRSSEFLHYATYPDGRNRYQIEQWPHPKRNVFTLIDKPVSEAEYRAHTSRDYGEQGLFLDAVIINKIIRDQLWRFNMRERPWRLNCFHWGQRFDAELDGDPAAAVARHFGMDETTVQIAFECVS